MRVAVGGYLVAVNTFATQKMGLDLFQRATLSGERVLRVGGAQGSIAGFLHGAQQYHWDIVPLQFVVPGVGGKVTTEAHEAAKAGFLDLLRKNPPGGRRVSPTARYGRVRRVRRLRGRFTQNAPGVSG